MFARVRWTILAIMLFSPLAAEVPHWSQAHAKPGSSGEHSPFEEESSKVDLHGGARCCRHRMAPVQRVVAVVLDPWITTHRARAKTVSVRDGGFSFMTHELSWRNGCGAALLC